MHELFEFKMSKEKLPIEIAFRFMNLVGHNIKYYKCQHLDIDFLLRTLIKAYDKATAIKYLEDN